MKSFLKKMGFLLVTLTLAAALAIPTLAANRAVTVNLHAKQGETVTIDAGDTNKLGKKKTIVVTATWDGEKLNPKKVKWSSSNKSVAKVSKTGVITVKKGAKVKKSATITAKYKYQKKWYKSKIKVKVTGVAVDTKGKKKNGWTIKEAVIQNRESGLNFSWQDHIYIYLPGLNWNDEDTWLDFEGLSYGDKAHINWAPSKLLSRANWTTNINETLVIQHEGITIASKTEPLSTFGHKDYYIVDEAHKTKWHIAYNLISCVPAMDSDIQTLLKRYLGTANLDDIRKQYTASDAATKIINGATNDPNVPHAGFDRNYWRNTQLFYWDSDKKGHIAWGTILCYVGIKNVINKDTSKATYGTPTKPYETEEQYPHFV